MSSLYELYSKRTKYKALRENVTTAINVLSRSSVNDGLSTVNYTLGTSYLVDDVACKSKNVEQVRDSLKNDLNNLNVCLSSINSKIYSLDKEIEAKEAEA